MARKLNEVESDLPKITGKDYLSPVKFELEIQRQRILYILHSALKKMRVMARLPDMLRDDCKILKLFLTPSEVDFVQFSCSKYMPGGQIDSLKQKESVVNYTKVLNEITMNQLEEEDNVTRALLGTLGDNLRVDYHIAQVIEIIMSNENLVNYVESNPDEISQPVFNLIECLRHLKYLIHEKLMITSKEQMETDKRLRVAYKSNFVITQNIKRLQEQMSKQQKELGAELEKKNAVLKSYNSKLEHLQEEFQAEMMKKVQKSEKQMMTDSFNSEARQVELEHEAHDAATQYANLLDSNLAEEGQLRQKRNKVEAQLASWLSKYDNDVGEKQTELEALEKQYNDMKTEFEELLEKFNEQTKEYDILMAEKEEEEQRIFEEMAMDFLRNRSARRIQRAWRAYWQRKLERRKARKAGKGKDKKKTKKEVPKLDRKGDANAVLQKTFKKKDYLFEEMDTTKQFSSAPVQVDLS
ncbi:dynein regulatory complex protein 10-like [Coccinella septempunctata]|uniref:dynein regulatory complex protein 10-like n=1 Tax=Coccinella septempunctata TaxID=41139 RepID=UPI001D067D90|nr:dynein regulatory complex protein 10-like [Coccinella septempunctata]